MTETIGKFPYPGRFHLDFQVKATLCCHFHRDMMDWLLLYRSSRQCEYRTLSIRTKQFIHLRMALECMLKALLICLSKRNESPKEAYTAARRGSHNIEKLVNECAARSSGRYRVCKKAMLERFRKIDSLGIGIRYDLDMKTAYKMQTPVEVFTESGPVSEVLLDYKFHTAIWEDILFIRDVYNRARTQRLRKHTTCFVARLKEIDDYIQRISPPVPYR